MSHSSPSSPTSSSRRNVYSNSYTGVKKQGSGLEADICDLSFKEKNGKKTLNSYLNAYRDDILTQQTLHELLDKEEEQQAAKGLSEKLGYSPAAKPENETHRLAELRRRNIESMNVAPFVLVVKAASELCKTPISLVSLVDQDKQWFHARVGLEADSTSREVSFCAHAILEPDQPFIVKDAQNDPRFASNPLVIGEPRIRFYAGIPLKTLENVPLGTLCVIDRIPRDLSSEQVSLLQNLAAHVQSEIELKFTLTKLNQRTSLTESLLSLVLPQHAIVSLREKATMRRESNTDWNISTLYDPVTVIFADLKDFTKYCSTATPDEVVDNLNRIWTGFDYECEKAGLYKVKTIGDCYMAISGVPKSAPDDADRAVEFCKKIHQSLANSQAAGVPKCFKLRVGLSTGPVIGGIIGTSTLLYDVWGDAVNMASRMEALCQPGRIYCSSLTINALTKECDIHYLGKKEVKGKGRVQVFEIPFSVQEQKEEEEEELKFSELLE